MSLVHFGPLSTPSPGQPSDIIHCRLIRPPETQAHCIEILLVLLPPTQGLDACLLLSTSYESSHRVRCKLLDAVGEASHLEASTKRLPLAALLLG